MERFCVLNLPLKLCHLSTQCRSNEVCATNPDQHLFHCLITGIIGKVMD